MARSGSSNSLIDKSPRIMGPKSKHIEDFSDFSKAVNLNSKKKETEDPYLKTQSINLSRDYNNFNKLNDSSVSDESVKMTGMQRSQTRPFKLGSGNHSPTGLRSPIPLRESLFSNENECLEFLLERMEGKSNYDAIFSAHDKMAIKEDRNVYSKIAQTKSLF